MELDINTMLNLSYMVIDYLKKSNFSRYVFMNMSEYEFWNLNLSADLCLKTITLYENNKMLEVRSPSVSLVEILDEFHSISIGDLVEDIYTPVFKEKLMNLIKDKTPELYRSYMSDVELVRDLSNKYNVNMEKVLDIEGRTYVVLKSEIKNKGLKEVANIIKKALKVFDEYCELKKGVLSKNIIKELTDPLTQIEEWLALIKSVYVANSKYKFPYIELSNDSDNPYGAPYIRFRIKNQVAINVIIILKSGYYIITFSIKEKEIKKNFIELLRSYGLTVHSEDSQLKIEKEFSSLSDVTSLLNNVLASSSI